MTNPWSPMFLENDDEFDVHCPLYIGDDMAMNDFGKGSVTVKKDELLEAVRKNRETHEAEYQEALKGFREASVKRLTTMLKNAKDGKVEQNLGLVEPVSHTKDYDRVIKMLEMSISDEWSVTERQFSQFVLDEWDWSAMFKATSAVYNNGR